jgi:hypothetical protein
LSVGCGTVAVLYARNIPNAVCVAPPEDEQVILETFRMPMSVGCGTVAVLYARNIPNAVSVAPPEDEQVMLGTCRGP